MNERLKELRLKLGLSQEELGERLGITKASVSRIEKAQVKFTESNILAICREFNVRREWLETGEGEMFEPPPVGIIDKLAAEYDLGPVARKFVEVICDMDDAQLDAVYRFMRNVVLEPEERATPPPTPEDLGLAPDIIAARVVKERQRERQVGAESRASPSTA